MTAVLTVALTVYAGQYVGQPLYCDTWDTELFYNDAQPPWVAMPDSFWKAGGECWDRVGIRIDGKTRYYYALDRMARGDWYVIQPDGVYAPIAADLPKMHAPFEGLSTTGQVWVVRQRRRARRR